MHIVMFYHSLVSDWNHGNAHFLRGVASELVARGHCVDVFEPADGWSLAHLLDDHGSAPLDAFNRHYPTLAGSTHRYDAATLDLDAALDGADLVLVHEWNPHDLVRRIGAHRRDAGGYALLFHDTHHRAATDARSMAAYDLRHYDGVLAFGEVLRELYLRNGWTQRAWTWHEAADTRVFRPLARERRDGDLVWIGNWGDGERSAELQEFLLDPAHALKLNARIHGVRYPAQALARLADAGVEYAGWLPNFDAPRVFARYAMTVHVPRRPYAAALAGIPTIRVFEALACGIPLISAPWDDAENLFRPGDDFLVANDGAAMKQCMRDLLSDAELAAAVAQSGLETIVQRHTCAHRVDELFAILDGLGRTTAMTTATTLAANAAA